MHKCADGAHYIERCDMTSQRPYRKKQNKTKRQPCMKVFQPTLRELN